MTLDEQIKEAEQKLADLKAEKERLKNDVNIADCWPTLGDAYIDIYGDLKSHWSLAEGFKPLDMCFSCLAQRQRAIRWHKIDKLWKHLAAKDRKNNKHPNPDGVFRIICKNLTTLGELLIDYNLWNKYPTCQPITYDFHSEDGIRSAINKIGNENLLFWFRGWEEK